MWKAVKEALPHGVVKLAKKRQELKRLGFTGNLWNPFHVTKVHWAARRAGLLMLPDNSLPALHTLVDVGANYGEWIEDTLKCAAPDKVIAFEPDPTALGVIRPKHKKSEYVQICEAAVGAEDGSVSFNVSGSSKLSSVLSPSGRLGEMYGDDARVDENVEAKMVALDSELGGDEEISILKIDVQGYELEVIKGAEWTLQKTEFLLIEANWTQKYKGGGTFADVHRRLTEDFHFRLIDMSGPLSVEGGASFSDALYQNERL
jgi:FkbM family methyltransferase